MNYIKIFVKIVNETSFKRSGLDLILEKNISMKDSLCGFSFEIK
jgi:DnaJ-class molecular chaperone